MIRWRSEGVQALWLGGGLYLEAEGFGLVLDAPTAAASALDRHGRLPRVGAIALSGGRLSCVGGLVPLLCALEPHRGLDVPLPIRFPYGEERGAMLAESWVRGWPDRYPLALDADAPDAVLDVGPFEVRSMRLERGEPRWLPEPGVEPVVGLGFQVRHGDVAVAFVPGAAPSERARHLCAGARLAVVEIGVVPWPRSPRRWRMALPDALACADPEADVWVVGDDGRMAGEEA